MSLHALRSLWRVVLLAVLLGSPALALAAITDAVEFYHPAFDHYFVTAEPNEIAALDGGLIAGWQRTGLTFKVATPDDPLAGAAAVCRFYGRPEAGLDSHFYSASASECAYVQQNFAAAWQFESANVFRVYPANPTTGACPSDSVPVYRAWNRRADSNHRYTTSLAVQQAMIAKGYVAEGYGSAGMPVAMCSPTQSSGPTVPSGPVAPACTLSASNTQPTVGQSIVLTASCSGTPTSYAWTGCASGRSTCSAAANTAGVVTYSVVASNAAGSSPAASVNVAWRTTTGSGAPPPVCSVSITTLSAMPVVGETAVMNATCSNQPQSMVWSGCIGSGATCYANEGAPGHYTYSLVANNAGGASTPVAVTADWVASPAPAPDFCGSMPSVLYSVVPWANTTLFSPGYPDPGFAWNGAWVERFTVPPQTPASTRTGAIDVVEYGSGPLSRQVTISRYACDFRPRDPSGANGPFFSNTSFGASASIAVGNAVGAAVALVPGQTYYVNVRNVAADGSISCPQATGNCSALIGLTLPR